MDPNSLCLGSLMSREKVRHTHTVVTAGAETGVRYAHRLRHGQHPRSEARKAPCLWPQAGLARGHLGLDFQTSEL